MTRVECPQAKLFDIMLTMKYFIHNDIFSLYSKGNPCVSSCVHHCAVNDFMMSKNKPTSLKVIYLVNVISFLKLMNLYDISYKPLPYQMCIIVVVDVPLL